MNKKLKKAMAIVSLVFMVLFAVSITMFFFDRTLFNNSIGYVALFTGFVGISVFVVIKLSEKAERKNREITVSKPEDTDKPDSQAAETEIKESAETSEDEQVGINAESDNQSDKD